MKPIKLVFSGLHSYKDEQVVDFTLLGGNKLFGIFGPTGAGKSTILDAITLALYGEVERTEAGFRCIINMAEKETRVAFTFSLGNDVYCIERVLGRPKDNIYSAVSKNCRLQNLTTGQILADKERDATKCIEDLLGLEGNDFSRAVALPQGQFSQFLRLTGGERGAMLARIFRLADFGDALYKKAGNRYNNLNNQLNLLEGQKNLLGLCSEEAIGEAKAVLADLLVAEKAAKGRVVLAETEQQRWQKLTELALEAEKLQQEEKKLLQQALCMEAKEKKLDAAKRAEPLRLELKRAKDLVDEERQLDATLKIALFEFTAAEEAYDRSSQKHLVRTENWQALVNAQERWEKAKLVVESVTDELQKVAAEIAEIFTGFGLDPVLASLSFLQGKQAVWEEELTAAQKSLKAWQIKNSAAVLAAELVPGALCPVCGSAEHPVLALAPDAAEEAKLFAEVTAAEKQAKMGELARVRLLEKDKQKEGILLRLAVAEAELATATEEKTLAEDAWEKSSEFLTGDVLAEIKEEAAETSLADLALDLAQKEAALKQAQSNKDSLQGQWDSLQGQIAKSKSILQQEIAKRDFERAGDAFKALVDEMERGKIEQELAAFKEDLRVKQNRLADLKEKLKGFDANLAKEAAENLTLARAEAEELLSQKVAASQELENLQANHVRWRQLEEETKRITHARDMAGELRNLLKGQALVNFLADEYLHQVVGEASHYLGSLTEQRYALEMMGSGIEQRFFLRDNFEGGQLRPANTLSGGETFLVSLALAWALSRNIQLKGQYDLEFFFLDEGFGTLSADKLELAINTLERLPAGKGLVGIISHVGELKTRLPYYFEVMPANNGEGSRIFLQRN